MVSGHRDLRDGCLEGSLPSYLSGPPGDEGGAQEMIQDIPSPKNLQVSQRFLGVATPKKDVVPVTR